MDLSEAMIQQGHHWRSQEASEDTQDYVAETCFTDLVQRKEEERDQVKERQGHCDG